MSWLWTLFSIDDDPDYDERQEAYSKLDSGQIKLNEVQAKVDKIAKRTEAFRESNKVNHYRQRLTAIYQGKR